MDIDESDDVDVAAASGSSGRGREEGCFGARGEIRAGDDRLERGGVAGHRPHALGPRADVPGGFPNRPEHHAPDARFFLFSIPRVVVRGVDTGRKVRPGDGQERAELDTVAIEPPRDPEEPAKPVANLSGRHSAHGLWAQRFFWRELSTFVLPLDCGHTERHCG